jgi:gliding motility-associated-like protein
MVLMVMLLRHILLLGALVSTLHAAWGQYEWIMNRGQWPETVAFKTQVQSGVFWTEKNGFTYQLFDPAALGAMHNAHGKLDGEILRSHVFRATFVNGYAQYISGDDKRPHYFNYYHSSDFSRHATHCEVYGRTKLHDVYAGIDVQVYAAGGGLKYDWVVAAGADPSSIVIEFDGVDCALVSRENGTDLVLSSTVQTIIEKQPYAYQVKEGRISEVRCNYKLTGKRLSYILGPYDKNLPLIIDPEVAFSTYIGSVANSWGFTACDDSDGNLIAGSAVFDPGYPTTNGAFSTTFNEATSNAFDIAISKFSADGSQLLYSTYFGGELQETPHSVVVDSQDRIIVFGVTGSGGLPITPGAYQTNFTGGPFLAMNGFFSGQHPDGCDLFVTKFNSDGSLLASTFVGGSDTDGLNNADQLFYNYGDAFRGEVNVDESDNVYVATVTKSADFPVTSGSFGGGEYDGVLFKLSPDLSSLSQSRFIGGNGRDACYAIEFNNVGQLIIAGGTQSSNFPWISATAADGSWNGETDGYVSLLDANAFTLVSGTFIGTSSYDQVYFAQSDNAGFIYAYGQTTGNMPITPGLYGQAGSGQFISKFAADLGNMEWNTTIGTGSGAIDISPTAFLVSDCEQVYLSGWGGDINNNYCSGQPGDCYANQSTTVGLPLTADAFQSQTDGSDFYLCVLTPNAQDILYGSYLGGNESNEHVDGGTSRFDKNGSVYHAVCAGCQNNDDFPTTPGVWSNTNESTGCNLAVFRFDLSAIQAEVEIDGPTQVCVGDNVEFINATVGASNYSWNFGDGSTSNEFQPVHSFAQGGEYTVQLIGSDNALCVTADTATVQITIVPDVFPQVQDDVVICSGETTQLIAEGSENIHWLYDITLSDLNVPNPIAEPSVTTTYYVVDENDCDAETLSVVVEVSTVDLDLSNDTSLCLGQSAVLIASGAMNYQWSPGDFLDAPNGAAPTCEPLESIEYTITATNEFGCADEGQIAVVVFNNVPGGLLYPALTVCEDEQIQLQAEAASAYNWSPQQWVDYPQAQSPFASPPDTTLFLVQVTNSCGTGFDSVYVNVIHPNVQAFGGGSICLGDTIGAWASGAVSYVWTPATWATPSNEALVYLSPENTTVFEVTGIDEYNCLETQEVTVSVYPSAEIDAGPDGYFDFPDSVMLFGNALGFDCYWWPSDGLSCDTCEVTWASPQQPTTYHLSIVDGFGCVNDDTVYVRPYFPIYVPNTFTPNDDGINDVFRVEGVAVTGFHLVIFDRWGMTVFESFDMNTPWTGDAGSGYFAPNDVYNWVLEYDSLDRRTKLKGHVVLVR